MAGQSPAMTLAAPLRPPERVADAALREAHGVRLPHQHEGAGERAVAVAVHRRDERAGELVRLAAARRGQGRRDLGDDHAGEARAVMLRLLGRRLAPGPAMRPDRLPEIAVRARELEIDVD